MSTDIRSYGRFLFDPPLMTGRMSRFISATCASCVTNWTGDAAATGVAEFAVAFGGSFFGCSRGSVGAAERTS